MCLDKLTKITITEGLGYQVFKRTDCGHIKPLYRGNKRPPIGVWQEDSSHKTLYADDIVSSPYLTGFHIYLEKPMSLLSFSSRPNELTLRKVKFSDVAAAGVQDRREVVVARKRYILPVKEE